MCFISSIVCNICLTHFYTHGIVWEMEESHMKIGYIRVSSKDQNESRQMDSMLNEGIDIQNIYVDKQSGKDFDRTQYKIMKKVLRAGDVLVIHSLDRFGRDYEEIGKEFQSIVDKGVAIRVSTMPILNTDQTILSGLTGKLIADIVFGLMRYIAEQERANIRQRQAEGIQSARRKGVKFGRPSKESKDFPKIAASVKSGQLTVVQACELLGISRKTFYNHAKKSGYLFRA